MPDSVPLPYQYHLPLSEKNVLNLPLSEKNVLNFK